MRKLLIGQFSHIKSNFATSSEGNLIHSIPCPPDRQLLFSLVWLQGRVLATSAPQTPTPHFLLDDGTGSVLVTIEPDTELPQFGSYVSVIGEILHTSSDITDFFPERRPSLTAWKLSARSVMCLSLVDAFFSNDGGYSESCAPSSAYAELAWPLEVMDMSRTYFAPLSTTTSE